MKKQKLVKESGDDYSEGIREHADDDELEYLMLDPHGGTYPSRKPTESPAAVSKLEKDRYR